MRINATLYFLLIASFCFAQKTVIHDNQQWFQYNNQLVFTKNISLFSDLGLRRINGFREWQVIGLRAGLGYNIAENLQGVTGIACNALYTNDHVSKAEFRAYQEINTKQLFRKVSLQHKLRIEARYFRNVTERVITQASSFNFRFRYRLFCAIPVVLSKKDPDKKLLLNFGDEVFVNAGKDIKYNMFDNNRLIAGTTLQWSSNLNFALFYIYQYGQRSAQATYEASDILFISVTQKIALNKKKDANKDADHP
jgi:hypothetical protein